MTDMKWKRLSFCGPGSWSEILAMGEMADDKRLPVWAGIVEVQVLLHFFLHWGLVWRSCLLEKAFLFHLLFYASFTVFFTLRFQFANKVHSNSHHELFVTCYSSKLRSRPVGRCLYMSHRPRGFLWSTAPDHRPVETRLQPAQCQWVTYAYSVPPITHRLHHVLPLSLFFFLSHISFMHTHTHTIPPVQKDGWDVPKPQVLLYLWVFRILHHTVQTSSVFYFLQFSPVVITMVLQL